MMELSTQQKFKRYLTMIFLIVTFESLKTHEDKIAVVGFWVSSMKMFEIFFKHIKQSQNSRAICGHRCKVYILKTVLRLERG